MKLIIFKIIIFLIVADIWSAQTKYSDTFKLFCGQPPIQDKIVGGYDTELEEFPFMARILVKSKPPIFICGGSLITDRHVLTATHCLAKYLNNTIMVSLGEHSVTPIQWPEHGMYYHVLLIISASDLYKIPLKADLAILVLSQKVKFTRRIAPICLPKNDPSDSLIGKEVTIIGFGRTQENNLALATTLQKVNLKVKPFKFCKYMAEPKGKICTSDAESNPCFGDEGGPLFIKTRRKEGIRYTQVGIVSMIPDYYCGKQIKEVISTDVNFYIDWIERVLDVY